MQHPPYPTGATPTDDAVAELVHDAALLWLTDHDVPESIATSSNTFLPVAERAFWHAVAEAGRMPAEQS